MVSNNDDRNVNLDIVDDIEENKVDAVVNDDENENIVEIDRENNETTTDNNE